MVSDCCPNLNLSVHMQEESAVDIVHSEWVSVSSDQAMFLYDSQVNKVSHGAQVDHGCCLDRICQCDWCSQMSY